MSLCDDLSHRHPNASEALAYVQSRRPCGMSRCQALASVVGDNSFLSWKRSASSARTH